MKYEVLKNGKLYTQTDDAGSAMMTMHSLIEKLAETAFDEQGTNTVEVLLKEEKQRFKMTFEYGPIINA